VSMEDQLRAALLREPAPPDFAAGVLAGARRIAIPFWRRPVTLALAASLTLAALIPPAISEHRRRERAEEAEAQLVTALAIAESQLERVSATIQRNTRRIP
jgi:hypothetical protein